MDSPSLKTIDLASLGVGMPGLTSACATHLVEAAAVCLEDRQHKSQVTMAVKGTAPCSFLLEWPPVDEQQRRCYNDLQEATERGAYGVAILLVRELTGKVVIERSKKGPGFDYWLGDDDDDDELPFNGKVRLEVSGILSGDDRQVDTRVKEKKKQIAPSDALAPGYVAVVEFGAPVAHVEMK